VGFVHYFHFTISRLYIYDILTCLFTISRLYIYDILTCLCVNLKHHEWKYIFVQFLNSTTELSIQFPSTSTISPMNTPLIHGHRRQQSTANDILSLTLPLDSTTTRLTDNTGHNSRFHLTITRLTTISKTTNMKYLSWLICISMITWVWYTYEFCRLFHKYIFDSKLHCSTTPQNSTRNFRADTPVD